MARRTETAMAWRRVARIIVITLCAIVIVPIMIITIMSGARSERP